MRQSTLSAASFPVDSLPPAPGAAPLLHPHPPLWVADLLPGSHESGASSTVLRSGSLAWLSRTIRGARDLPIEVLRTSVAQVYAEIGRALATTRTTPLRVWNYLPDPGVRLGPGLDRYMVFNAGRHDGYREWLPSGTFERELPTATAVGVTGDDLVVHCLASEIAGRAVQNPRQRPPWQYSARYGPLPPTFSRGTVAALGERRMLLIGGTASIVGEDSVHLGDPEAQLEETLINLATVIGQAAPAAESPSQRLARLTELRVYVAPEADARDLHSALRVRCTAATRIDMRVARLCRPELLVEIEGIAELPAAPAAMPP